MKRKNKKRTITDAHYEQLINNLAKANRKKKWLQTSSKAIPILTKRLNNYADKLQQINSVTSLKIYKKYYDLYIKAEKNLLYAKQSQAHTLQQKEYWKEKRSYMSKRRKIDKLNKKKPEKRSVGIIVSKQNYINNVLWYEVDQLIKQGYSQDKAEDIAWKQAIAEGKIVDLEQNNTGVEWGYIDLDNKEVISPI